MWVTLSLSEWTDDFTMASDCVWEALSMVYIHVYTEYIGGAVIDNWWTFIMNNRISVQCTQTSLL